MKYNETKWAKENTDTGQICNTWLQWDEAGIHHQTNGPPFAYGANISQDGKPGWQNYYVGDVRITARSDPRLIDKHPGC
jgi:hypothetical protein